MIKCILERLEEILHSIESFIDEGNHGIGLLSGNAGIAIFLFYYADIFNDKIIFDKGVKVVEGILDEIKHDQYVTFSAGIPGVAYMLNLLKRTGIIHTEIDQDANEYIATVLKNKMKVSKVYDYLHGILGISLYFIEKEEFTSRDAEIICDVIDFIDQVSIIDERSGGIKWQCMFNLYDGVENYDLSLAHGSAGIILILCKIYKLNVERRRVELLIVKNINYILSNELQDRNCHSYFPSGIKKGIVQNSRLAWCYCDLGIAWALWKAGNVLNNNNWITKAFQVFEYSTKRRLLAETSIIDAGFCHGISGVSYFFSRIYEETGEQMFKDASNYWLHRLLDFNIPGGKAAGYKSFYLGKWYDNFSLLEGISGIGLVLLSTLEKQQFWNKLFLLD